MTRRAIIYARISADRADETGTAQGKGVADQEQDARALATRLGWAVERVVTENDTSAFKRKRVTLPDGSRALRVVRPGFRSVLDDLANGRADALIALDLDRAVRDPRDLEDLIDVVEERRIPVESVTGSLRLATDADITMARVLVALANKASRDTARRVARSKLRAAAEGTHGGGKRMFGFEKDGITLRPAEAAEIVAASNRVLEGVSVREVTRDLRDRGVPTVEGGPWTTASVRYMLVRPRNAAIVTYKGERLDASARWKPIVTTEVWEAVVSVLSDPGRRTAPGNTPSWLGSGLYRCACGGPMRVHGPARYRCTSVVFGLASGPGHSSVAARLIDEFVEDVVLARLARPDSVQLFAPAEATVDIAGLRVESSTLRVRLSALAEDFADGVLTRAQLAAGTKRVEARLREVDEALARSASRTPLAPLLGADDVRAQWAGLPLSSRRAIIAALVSVEVGQATTRGRTFDTSRIAITWISD